MRVIRIEQVILNFADGYAGARQFGNLAGQAHVVRVEVGNHDVGDVLHGEAAVLHLLRQGVKGLGRVPAGIDHEVSVGAFNDIYVHVLGADLEKREFDLVDAFKSSM